ncbi:MAG TPA: glycosyltransferase [Flavobacteriales bacterium]|nr:glycosyltransferase [Flavobacteriales bacterium]HIK62645.1 glycosyltransferase [Flavobacteriales bacterium]
MKITLLSTAYPYRGGIAVFTERLARAFQDTGDKVNISTFSLQYPSFLFPGKSQYSTSEKPKDLEIISEVNSVNPINWLRIGLKIKKQKPDILILKYWIPFMSPCLGTISRIVKSNKHTKVIVVVDNLIPHEKRMGDNLLNSYFVDSVDGFITMSKSVYDDLDQFDKNKKKILGVHPLYDSFGVSKTKEESLDSLKLDKGFNYMLFFGIIRKYKGLDILLEAFADERLQNQKLKLIVAGEFYENEKPYLDLIDKYNLSESVILATNFIPDDEVVNYFCAADIIVQPYRNATQSGVTQIAYHFEKPMLVTDVGGLKEIVPHGKVGYVCNPNSGSVVDAILDFYNNDKEQQFIQGVIDEKTKYSWNKMIENIKNLYQQL